MLKAVKNSAGMLSKVDR